MAVDPEGRPAVTEWKVVAEGRGCTLLDVHILTGRTHQIRVHMAHIGHPVLGDPLYGGCSKFAAANASILCGQCLHAKTLGFVHPITGETMRFDSPLPPYFETILQKLRTLG